MSTQCICQYTAQSRRQNNQSEDKSEKIIYNVKRKIKKRKYRRDVKCKKGKCNICRLETHRAWNREKDVKPIFKEIMAEKFLLPMKKDLQIMGY